MNLRRFFHPCLLGHPSDPVIVLQKGVMVFACSRCHEVIGKPLPKQRLKVRPVAVSVISGQFGKKRRQSTK